MKSRYIKIIGERKHLHFLHMHMRRPDGLLQHVLFSCVPMSSSYVHVTLNISTRRGSDDRASPSPRGVLSTQVISCPELQTAHFRLGVFYFLHLVLFVLFLFLLPLLVPPSPLGWLFFPQLIPFPDPFLFSTSVFFSLRRRSLRRGNSCLF